MSLARQLERPLTSSELTSTKHSLAPMKCRSKLSLALLQLFGKPPGMVTQIPVTQRTAFRVEKPLANNQRDPDLSHERYIVSDVEDKRNNSLDNGKWSNDEESLSALGFLAESNRQDKTTAVNIESRHPPPHFKDSTFSDDIE